MKAFPNGISRAQTRALVAYASRSKGFDAASFSSLIEQHLRITKAAYERNRIVNLRLATAIASAFNELLVDWDAIPVADRCWIGGAILYFADTDDTEHDFNSSIGFEDDAEVLNACLMCVGRESLCIDIHEYDDA